VLNRAIGSLTLFTKPADYEAFERVLQLACQREPLRILSYCIMPNHWHLVVWPQTHRDDQVSQFMRWLTLTHTQRWHAHFHTAGTGPIYQGRFKSFPVQSDEHLWTVVRYLERNPKRAQLVRRAEDWQWSSLYHWQGNDELAKTLLHDLPTSAGQRPSDWVKIVNRPQTEAELAELRRCVNRGRPFGDSKWTTDVVNRSGLDTTVRPRGRPRKHEH
jgi:putative transposase